MQFLPRLFILNIFYVPVQCTVNTVENDTLENGKLFKGNKCLLKIILKLGLKGVELNLKGVFAKNESGYRRNAKNKRFQSQLILLLSVASIRRKLLKTIHTEERSAHTNSESCNIQLGS